MKRNVQGGKPSSWIRQEKRHAIYARDYCLCAWCGVTVTPDNATLDHIWPEGHPCRTNEATDLTTACWECNNHKQAIDPLTYLERLALGGFPVHAILSRLGRRVVPLDIAAGRRLLDEFRTRRNGKGYDPDAAEARIIPNPDDIPF